MTGLATAVDGMRHWDWCPICRGALDTGLECDSCGADFMPIQKALTEKTMKPTDPAVLAHIRARAVRCRLGYGGRAWVTSDPKSEVVEDRMWLLEYIDQETRAMNRLREQLQIAADSFRNLGCAVDADDCEEAINESLSGGNPGESKACTPAEKRGIVGATGAGQHPDGDGESTRDSAERRSPAGTTGTPAPDESNRHPNEPLADPIVPIEIGAGKIRVAICYDIGDPDKVLRELVIYDDGEGFKPVGTDLPEHRGKKVPDVGRVLARLHISNAEGAAVFVRDLQTVVEHARVADGGAALTKADRP